jgi:hypothetical protein
LDARRPRNGEAVLQHSEARDLTAGDGQHEGVSTVLPVLFTRDASSLGGGNLPSVDDQLEEFALFLTP